MRKEYAQCESFDFATERPQSARAAQQFGLTPELRDLTESFDESTRERFNAAYRLFADGQKAFDNYVAQRVQEPERKAYFADILQRNEKAFAEQVAAGKF